MADPCLVRVQQSPPKFHEGIQVRQIAYRPPRIHSPYEQHLRRIDIADAGQVPLVEQGLPDGAVRFGAQPPHRLVAVPVRAEKIGAQVAGDP